VGYGYPSSPSQGVTLPLHKGIWRNKAKKVREEFGIENQNGERRRVEPYEWGK